MSRYDLLKAIGNVDEESIREAKEEKKKSNKAIWATVGSIAACLVLVLIIPIAMNMFDSNKGQGEAAPGAKPNMNSIYWLPTGNNSADIEDSDGSNQKKIDGLNVSDALYKAINETDNVNFGILVTATSGKDTTVTDKISLFTATGIYAEIVDNKLFIFPTKDEFLNMKLSEKQKDELYFSLVGKSVYTGENEVEVPSTDISEWEGIDPSKFAIEYSTISEGNFTTIEEFKKAYESIYEVSGWNADAVIGMQFFLTEAPGEDEYFDYMEYESLVFWTYPDRAYVVIKLANLNVSDILKISEDARVSKVYITPDIIGNDGPVAG